MSIVKFQTLENPNTSPLHVLANIKKAKTKVVSQDIFNSSWVKDLKLLLPCENVDLPKDLADFQMLLEHIEMEYIGALIFLQIGARI